MAQPIHSRYRSALSSSGFTLLEMIVVLVVVGVLATILTPKLTRMVDEARIVRASNEVQEISKAALNFRQNTGRWPIFQSGVSITTGSDIYDVLVGPGSDPDAGSTLWLTGAQGDIEDVLLRNTPLYTTVGRFQWRGPYLGELGSDPWGNAYLINTKTLRFGGSEAGLVLSAGPNGTIETTFQQTIGSGSSAVTIGGDDIAARIR